MAGLFYYTQKIFSFFLANYRIIPYLCHVVLRQERKDI